MWQIEHKGKPTTKKKGNLLVSVQFIHTVSIDTICVATQVNLRFASLSAKSIGTFAGEVVDEVGTIAAQ